MTIGEIIALLRPRLPRLLLAVLFGTLALGSALALAAVAAWLITRAWQMPPVLDLTVAVVAVRALGISRGVFSYCERLAIHDTALRAAGQARVGLYRRLVAQPPESVLRLHSGDLVARVGTSVDELADVLVRAVLPVCVAAVLSVAAVGIIAVISPAAAVVLAAGLLIAGVLAPALAARAAEATELLATRHHSSRDTATLVALEHAAELRVAGRLDDVIAEAGREHRELGAAQDAAAAPAATAAAASTAAVGVSVLGAVVIGILLADHLAPTSLAILMLLPLSAFEATTALPGAAAQWVRSKLAAQRLADLGAPDPAERARLQVDTVPLNRGDHLAVIGPSGCGKTTLLMAMAAEYPENPVIAAFFAEDAHLFDTTVRDNLLVGRGDATDPELRTALRTVGLEDWLGGLPDGLGTVLTGGAAAVSAGQRRRLLLARALITDFPIVLLDEPTEHLDAADSDRILTALLTPGGLFAADRTVVVATHHLPAGLTCPTIRLESARG
ncbi:ATP-binding cassette domain-containing protein [Mycolicibacterium bacteremicum]|uniref:ABC transporter ATP-binding protein n=1 Tax=Mycolicibacterium bacteremicum TaxID=564198 RepID=A0A1W9YP50_MYCBA|nr:ATP-binding cassette domain-containing protein [Mycolicibacterium bacteremicum]MCV7430365.1 ATP-binding cassette domain-containing protein [Mycolicibacterium bacteremicum]ORA01816.1 ABC transporter ATP-binding protein [Mycolicibacterium bacteremicum]